MGRIRRDSDAGKKGTCMGRKKQIETSNPLGLPEDYMDFLESLKSRVRQAQTKAMLSVNRELIQLYWDIGRLIVQRQEREGWGQKVIDRIARDIQKEFPGIEGFSSSNISRMRAFFRAYRKDQEISAQAVPKLAGKKSAHPVPISPLPPISKTTRQFEEPVPPQEVAHLPWGHNVVLLFKVKDHAQRLWYACKTIEHAGVEQFSQCKSKAICSAARGRPSVTLPGRCPLHNPISPSRR